MEAHAIFAVSSASSLTSSKDMSETAIAIEQLGKIYLVGEREKYFALRDVLTQAFVRPFLRLRRRREPKREPKFFWALKDVSIDIKKGEVVGLIGRNGAGKSTLLKILARVTDPTEGRARISGRIGSLLEVGTGFHYELTGRENIFLSGAYLGMATAEVHAKFDEIVNFAGVHEFIDTPVKHYSSGMYTRLAFAVAAHLEPEILLMDEVLAVGDIEFQKKCLGKMGSVARTGRTILFVSHQMTQIRRLCDRCIWLDAGRIAAVGPTVDIVGQYEEAMVNASSLSEATSHDSAETATHFLGWRLLNVDGEGSSHTLRTQAEFSVEFRMRVADDIRNAHFGIALYNADNLLMWANAFTGLSLDRGVRCLKLTLPSMPLKPGQYTWKVALYTDAGLADSYYCFPNLTIGTIPLTHWMDQWQGLLNIGCDISVF